MENLDKLCAEYGYRFADEIKKADNFDAKKAESLVTKALGVLQEQGLYAFLLFCESRGKAEKAGADKIKEITAELLKKLQFVNGSDLLKEIRKDNGLASRLDDLILAIQVLEKSLIYARYHAKAFSNPAEENVVIEGTTK
ncbi:MAG: type III-B CRISPR module-associated protein Cmr5 [Candidatus Saccharicenans sp.]|nr:type III-B CRISPR module-associated protein Cmr5 [Candidatus Saccharicenans sp.]